MSVKVMAWVFDHSRSRLGERLTLLAIADSASASGEDAWPSIPEIARKAGLSQRNVHRAIDGLKESGEIEVDKRLVNGRWRNCYRVVMGDNPSPRTPDKSSPDELSPDKSSADRSDTRPLTNTTAPPDKLSDPPTPPYKEEPSRTVQEPSSSALALRDDPDGVAAQTTAQTIVAEWIDRCRKRPPANVIGQVSKHTKALLEEGFDPDDIRRGLAQWMVKGLHPSTIPSVVNEVINSGGPAPVRPRQSTADQRAGQALALAQKYAQEGQ